ncbi:MAG: metal-dependent hydrolase [Bacteroidetes bacterium QS_1_63_11]|nr:MAG: metal-dependent hydrolase [Bacteroidetes bacterium QS_1_63_11]
MDLTYFGHSTFQIDTEDATLLFDPFFAENPHTETDPSTLDPDVLLITHAHFDHFSDTEAVLNNSDPLVISNFEITQYVQQNYDHDAIQPLNEGGYKEFDWGLVESTHARHSSSLPDGTYGGVPNGFVLELGDDVIYNTGDTAPFAEMQWVSDLRDVDVMLAPIGNVFTMDIYGALHAADMVEPDLVIPLHYDTFPPLKTNLDAFENSFEEEGYETRVFGAGETAAL